MEIKITEQKDRLVATLAIICNRGGYGTIQLIDQLTLATSPLQ